MDRVHVEPSPDPPEAPAPSRAASPHVLFEEGELWGQFSLSSSPDQFCESWLALQCRMIPEVSGGVVLLGPPDTGPFSPVAVWPQGRRGAVRHLAGVAERAIRERQGLVQQREVGDLDRGVPAVQGHEVAYPLQVDGRLHGVVALDVAPRAKADLQTVLRQLHWGVAWLEVLVRREHAVREAVVTGRLQTVLEAAATVVGEQRFHAAAMALATNLATRLGCDRVSLGFLKGGHVRVRAVSHSAHFNKQANLIRAIGSAMDEALDQQATILVPPPPDQPPLVRKAHEDFVRVHGTGALCTVLLRVGSKPVGAMTFERPPDRPFDPDLIQTLEALTTLTGPILEVHRRDDRWLGAKAAETLRAYLAKLLGPYHVVLKLVTLALVGLVAFFAVAEGDYRVSAKTLLEGQILRAIVAPFDGYIADAQVRAGDIVLRGRQLAALDDRELRLEQLKWISQHQQHQKEYSQALAKREAAQVEILSAQIGQALAQLALLEDQLAKTHLLAPIDGVVVTGDLSQKLSSPVQRGEVLFEVAPLDVYRVVLQVDERDIDEVRVGQRGQLLLSAFPDTPLPFTVEKITPVSEAKEGRNFFRVEAALADPPSMFRPGMEGVGKIEIDRRLLIWIWTHEAIDWVRLTLWKWLP